MRYFKKALRIVVPVTITVSVLFGAGLGCSKKATDLASTATTTTTSPDAATPLTAAQIAGSHFATCQALTGADYGASLNGYSILRYISLNANLTYSLGDMLFTGSACQAGGTEIFVYVQGGTFALGAVMTAPAGATEITYTAISSSLTIYGTAGLGSTWAGYFNTYCPGGPTNFNTSGTSSNSEAGHTCANVSNPAFSFPIFPADGTVFKDSIALNSVTSPSIVTTSTTINLFIMGQYSTFPTTGGFNYSF